MKLQFSLATLLVCVTMFAAVCAFAIHYPVVDIAIDDGPFGDPLPAGAKIISVAKNHTTFERPPNVREIALRFVKWGTAAVVVMLGTPWLIRRQKSRRHTEPPVG
jgi:hypothetical protein